MNDSNACTAGQNFPSVQFQAIRWRRSGPYFNLVVLLVLGLLILSVSRIGLVAWQHDRVEAAGIIGDIFVQGIRADLILLGYFIIIPLALAPFLAHKRTAHLWSGITRWWTSGALVMIGFLELASPQFILQYDVRPNRLFIEYLAYPAEVFGTLWTGYRPALVATVGGTAVLALLLHKALKRLSVQVTMWPATRLYLTWPVLMLIVVMQIRSTTAHRPANTALFALSSDAMVNSLVINSAWSVLDAVNSLRKEANSSEIYGTMARADILVEITDAPWLRDYRYPRADRPTLHYQQAAITRDRPLNLVIVLEESLGATFVESLGGLPVTPELEKLKHEGWWFEQLYATGTRSVRGIEAVVAGYPPTPARSVVKLSLAQHNFYTLALGLGKQGYQTEFVYGGEAHFDNMRSFFTGNGFQRVVDRQSMQPRFVGSWGASDEDLFDTALQRLNHLHAQQKPFFSLIFTSSNHAPFEFPDGKIALHDPDKQSVNNAVKYADYALGKFIRSAKLQDYWHDTVFLIVADHDNRVYGDSLVPIKKFHIPGLILGADITPRRIQTVASQIDLGPTLLSLMGVSSHHPMIGRDLVRDSTSPGRAMLQFDNNFAWIDDASATILQPGVAPVSGRYHAGTGQLTLDPGKPDQRLVRRAMAHVMLPSLLYREQRYKGAD